MIKLLIIALLTTSPVFAQIGQPSPKLSLTDRQQIQADRAKAAAEDQSAPTARPWDRDAKGERPWQEPEKRPDEPPKP
jgi:hypothetical protein